MSRSNNTELINPAKRFFEWNGDKGGFRFYDKELKVKVEVPVPFRFMVLDCLATIKGFDEPNKSGFWSNEIRDLKKETVTVKNKTGICFEGLYENLNLTGAKYCQSVYIAHKEGGNVKICNIQMIGAALGAWIDFRKQNRDVSKGAITVNEFIEGKKGKNIYQIPVFKKIPASPASEKEAIELDVELQKYLKLYFAKNSSAISEKQVEQPMEPIGNNNEGLMPPPEREEDQQDLSNTSYQDGEQPF